MERFLEREQEVEECFRCKYSSKTYSLSSIFVFLPGFKEKNTSTDKFVRRQINLQTPTRHRPEIKFQSIRDFFSGLLEGFLLSSTLFVFMWMMAGGSIV